MSEERNDKIQIIHETFPAGVFQRTELLYYIRGTKAKFIVREYFRAINKEIKNCPTNISRFYKGKNFSILGYIDSDLHSNFDSGMKGPIKVNGQDIQHFVKESPDPNNPSQKIWNFGIEVNTDLSTEDFYWIEIHCLIEDLLVVKNNLYMLGLVNQIGDEPYFTEMIIHVPNEPEGFFVQKITEIEKLCPAPNKVYGDSGYKIYSWTIDKARPKQIDRVDIWYRIRKTYNPLIKNVIYIFIGLVIGTILSPVLINVIVRFLHVLQNFLTAN